MKTKHSARLQFRSPILFAGICCAAMMVLAAGSFGMSSTTTSVTTATTPGSEISRFAKDPRAYNLTWTTWVLPDTSSFNPNPCPYDSKGTNYPQILYPEYVNPNGETQYDPKQPTIVVPYAAKGSFHATDMSSFSGIGYVASVLDKFGARKQVADGRVEIPGNTDERLVSWGAALPTQNDLSYELEIKCRVICYNASIDESAVQGIKPPVAWPVDASIYLQPSAFIESDSSEVRNFVASFTNGKAQTTPPWLCAKALAQHVVQMIHSKEPSSDTEYSLWTRAKLAGGLQNNLSVRTEMYPAGMHVVGAQAALKDPNSAGQFDAVCLFVATCRASNIPARPVIGIRVGKTRTMIAWAEFFEPEIGWVTVDMDHFMANPGNVQDIRRSWDGFGSDSRLNNMIPLAYRFVPEKAFLPPNAKPLIWGTSLQLPSQNKLAQIAIVDVSSISVTDDLLRSTR